MLISEPQSKYILLGDIKLHYLEWGTPGKTPLVMLHGWGDTAWLFKRMARPFENDYHLFSLDLRGHGQTPDEKAGHHSQIVWVIDLERFLDALDLREVVLAGYSFGGTIAHRYLASHPERVKALAIIDIGVENTSATFNPTATPEQIQASIFRAWDRFSLIQCPTLLVMAEHSHLLRQEVARRMVEIIPRGKLVVIEGIDHKIFKRHPEIAEALQDFLKSCEAQIEPSN